ncbi:FAA hydrolase family protein [Corallincola spongiicola]|uniref:FAA hydrolase family protein n=1 Tax=Corallincola spongiicola TaxID=2520508 RepID=A0ABY1WME5_9GAMM|nr:FAA hydrolase family protein [Corallincola spongiicola]
MPFSTLSQTLTIVLKLIKEGSLFVQNSVRLIQPEAQTHKPITPAKIVCVGRNYVDHIKELNNEVPEQPVYFLKPNSAISNTLYSVLGEPLHYETEICFLVEQGKLIAAGVGLDITKRGLQSQLKAKSLPWERAKAFDGSALFSDFVVIDSLSQQLQLKLWIDGVLVQQGGISLMLHKPDVVLADIAEFMTLQDGDILMTGTPKGVGQIVAGQRFVAQLLDGEQCLTEVSWVAV